MVMTLVVVWKVGAKVSQSPLTCVLAMMLRLRRCDDWTCQVPVRLLGQLTEQSQPQSQTQTQSRFMHSPLHYDCRIMLCRCLEETWTTSTLPSCRANHDLALVLVVVIIHSIHPSLIPCAHPTQMQFHQELMSRIVMSSLRA